MGEKLNINKIKGCLAENNQTQMDLAILLNTSLKSVNNKMNERFNFSIEDIEKIAFHFKKPVGYFFDKIEV